MIDFALLSEAPLWRELGLVLVHFLWQGTLIAVLAALFFRALRHRTAAERYAVGCLALSGLLVLPACTWWWIGRASAATAVAAVGVPAGAAGSGGVDPFGSLHASTGGFEWLALLGVVWFAGAIVQQVRLLLSYLRAGQLRRRESTLAPASWQDTMRELGGRLGLKRAVSLYQSSLARVPLIVGWLEPIVLVPVGTLSSMSPLELRAILAHELAHLRRLDHLVNALQVVLESLLFFHPAVWWLSARVREEREYCCDDLAVEVCGDALFYARALTSLEELRLAESALILSSNGGSLMHRIRRLVNGDRAASGGRAYLAAPALFGALVLGLTSGSAYGVAPTTHDCDHHHCEKHGKRAQMKSCDHGTKAHTCGKHSPRGIVVVGENPHQGHVEKHNPLGIAHVHGGKGIVRVGDELAELHVVSPNPLGGVHLPGLQTVTEEGSHVIDLTVVGGEKSEEGLHGVLLETAEEPDVTEEGKWVIIDREDGEPVILEVGGLAGRVGISRSTMTMKFTDRSPHEPHRPLVGTLVKPEELHTGKAPKISVAQPGELHVVGEQEIGELHTTHEISPFGLRKVDESHPAPRIRVVGIDPRSGKVTTRVEYGEDQAGKAPKISVAQPGELHVVGEQEIGELHTTHGISTFGLRKVDGLHPSPRLRIVGIDPRSGRIRTRLEYGEVQAGKAIRTEAKPKARKKVCNCACHKRPN